MTTEQLSMSMFTSKADYDAAVRAQAGALPDGLQLACDAISLHCAIPNPMLRAIRAEHQQRVTLQHHAADQAQRIADLDRLSDMYKAAWDAWAPFANYVEMLTDTEQISIMPGRHLGEVAATAMDEMLERIAELESIVNAPRGTDAQIMKEREIAAAAIDGALAFGYQGTEAPEAWHWLLAAHNAGKRIAELEAERDKLARGYRSRHDADSAELRRLCADRDAARKERDELRARLDAATGQEPVATVRHSPPTAWECAVAEINAMDLVVAECAREIAAQDAGSDFAALMRIIDAQAAEIERLRGALRFVVHEWESVPGGGMVHVNTIQRWLMKSMKPAIDKAREVLKEQK